RQGVHVVGRVIEVQFAEQRGELEQPLGVLQELGGGHLRTEDDTSLEPRRAAQLAQGGRPFVAVLVVQLLFPSGQRFALGIVGRQGGGAERGADNLGPPPLALLFEPVSPGTVNAPSSPRKIITYS